MKGVPSRNFSIFLETILNACHANLALSFIEVLGTGAGADVWEGIEGPESGGGLWVVLFRILWAKCFILLAMMVVGEEQGRRALFTAPISHDRCRR